MADPFFSSENAAKAVHKFEYNGRQYEVAAGSIILYDEQEHAEWLAQELGTYSKSASMKHEPEHVFSIVGLPQKEVN